MGEHTLSNRTTAAGGGASLATMTAGPRSAALARIGAQLNRAPAVQRVAAMAPANRTGLPDGLKAGIENLSGMSMDAVRVHRNSAKPAQLNAHAYAQGTDIHLAPGQEQHLPHEAWHVVQQAQGRVRPTMQMKTGQRQAGVPVNDDPGLEREADVMGARAMGAAVQRVAHDAAVSLRPLHNPVVAQKVAQRAGVKAELEEAQHNFEEFMDETNLIDDTRNEVATAIYNTYKPGQAGDRGHFSDKIAHKGVNPGFDHGVALEKAQRLNHWTNSAISAASRIYEELLGATQYNDNRGVGLENITMGQDTKTEPDVFVQDNIAFESKHIVSPSQGSVDGHITKCSEQLDSRKTNGIFNLPITKWVAHIAIDNEHNPWPYSPVKLKKAIKSKKLFREQEAKTRIQKYENAKVLIRYEIRSKNPDIGDFDVKA